MTTLILVDDDIIEPHPANLTIDDHIIFMFDQDHPNFRQNVERAIKLGFRHPLLSTKLLDKPIKMAKPSLFLYHKYNNEYGKKIDSKQYEENKKRLQFCMNNYKTSQDDSCSISIQITDDTITYLKNYSKTYKFQVGDAKEQREVSGRFFLYETIPNRFLVTVDTETANLGGKEETASVDTLASFHTHPMDAYHKYKVCMAWPSVDDYCVFLGIYANGYGMFHILGTVEGIYVITISEKLLKEGREKIRDKLSYYENHIKEHYHVDYPTCFFQEEDKDNNKVWSKKIEKYLDTMNSKKYFHVQFFLWDDAIHPINITYNSVDKNCILSDEQIKFNDLLTKHSEVNV